ncbi:hypothetical protein HH310_01105 [Actinoplanes sp. TBRC 11911]|uniref:hypothetical protein n=1 Tax=Actinoplanes sp. TBRC 11911 TaxID=2729386 RepID=UPI00145D0124|nr:hypothetical protein [Actinoplanes sp. TBRC 11911]NMO49798.1 hypothetical protein [Actinoplanes sp. TBRC 11911]
MRTKTLLAGALAGATALTLVGGCAAKEIKALEPKLELRNAAQQLSGSQQAGFTIKLSGKPEDLIAAIKQQEKTDGTAAADKFGTDDETIVKQVFNSSFTVAYDKGGAGATDDKSMLAATIDGVTGTELRAVDGTLYVKAPVTDLAAKFGAKAADVAAIREQAAGTVPGLSALFDGKWVSVDSKELTGLAGAEAGVPTPSAQQEQVVKELTTSANNLLDGATVVRDSADDNHIVVTSSTVKAYTEGQRLADTLLGKLGNELPKTAPKDRPIVMDLWVDNGKFTAAEINLLQFVDGATGRVAVRIDVASGQPIAAPTGATKIDTKSLAGAMAGLPTPK